MLDLTGVFARSEPLDFAFSLDLSTLEFFGGCPFGSPVAVSGRVSDRAGIVTLSATADFVYRAACDRCGKAVERRYSLPFSHVIVTGVEDEEQDELIIAEDMQLDAEALIREDLVLWVPLKFLCSEDCRGLCDRCGKNLNEGPCGCGGKEIDPRLAALQSLLK